MRRPSKREPRKEGKEREGTKTTRRCRTHLGLNLGVGDRNLLKVLNGCLNVGHGGCAPREKEAAGEGAESEGEKREESEGELGRERATRGTMAASFALLFFLSKTARVAARADDARARSTKAYQSRGRGGERKGGRKGNGKRVKGREQRRRVWK